jgi:hypothetical protein
VVQLAVVISVATDGVTHLHPDLLPALVHHKEAPGDLPWWLIEIFVAFVIPADALKYARYVQRSPCWHLPL